MPAHLREEWEAYYQLEPFGQAHQDLGFAYVASAIHNVNRSRGSTPITPGDFYHHLRTAAQNRVLNAAEACEMFARFANGFGPPAPRKILLG